MERNLLVCSETRAVDGKTKEHRPMERGMRATEMKISGKRRNEKGETEGG